jgi:hypothetical protein
LRTSAPVNAPFSWPNSSASRIVSGSAAMLTAQNGRSRRPESWWIARATSSLPVPLSPWISTDDAESATLCTMRNTSCIEPWPPTMFSSR